MTQPEIKQKKFLDIEGLKHFWEKIKNVFNALKNNIDANKNDQEKINKSVSGSITNINNRLDDTDNAISGIKDTISDQRIDIDTLKTDVAGNARKIDLNKTSIDTLASTKQNNLHPGYGISLDKEGNIKYSLDNTLFTIVDKLPTEGIDESKIYLVPDPNTSTFNKTKDNTYKHYIFIKDEHAEPLRTTILKAKGRFEQLGQFQGGIDLQALKNVDADLSNKIAKEIQDRTGADTALGGRIDKEAQAREAADTALGSRITKEVKTINGTNDALRGDLTAETQARIAADEKLESRKQNKLVPGRGISVDEQTSKIKCTLDISLYKVVTELPTEKSEILENKIYLVQDKNDFNKDGSNKYAEYIFMGISGGNLTSSDGNAGRFEKIGEYHAGIDVDALKNELKRYSETEDDKVKAIITALKDGSTKTLKDLESDITTAKNSSTTDSKAYTDQQLSNLKGGSTKTLKELEDDAFDAAKGYTDQQLTAVKGGSTKTLKELETETSANTNKNKEQDTKLSQLEQKINTDVTAAKNDADSKYLPLTGGTLTGPLNLANIGQGLILGGSQYSAIWSDGNNYIYGAGDKGNVLRSNNTDLVHKKIGKGDYKIYDEDNLKIGVRNLLRNSNKPIHQDKTSKNYLIGGYDFVRPMHKGDKVTIVIRGKCEGPYGIRLYEDAHPLIAGDVLKGQDGLYILHYTIDTGNSSGVYDNETNRLNFYNDGDTAPGTTFDIYWACVYEGHILPPQDWTQAPEDALDRIQTLEAKRLVVENHVLSLK